MKPAGVIARVFLLLFLAWLYGGDVVRWGQAQTAEVTALAELPRLWLGCWVPQWRSAAPWCW